MIRNVVLHLNGELPMKADIESLPTSADVGLLCTNLRTMEGRKPLSTEFLDSVFLIPYNMIRFIEIPRAAIGEASPSGAHPQIPAMASEAGAAPIVTPPPVFDSAPEPAPEPRAEDVALEDVEPDADLLRRIREA